MYSYSLFVCQEITSAEARQTFFAPPLRDKTAFQVVSPATDSEIVLRHHKMGCVRGISYKKDTQQVVSRAPCKVDRRTIAFYKSNVLLILPAQMIPGFRVRFCF